MWPFGRKRDAIDPTRCAECGRTLLSGEWTQRVVDEDGRELLICSLCSQSHSWESPADAGQTPTAQDGSRATASERDTRRRSDAFWLALKEKDAEIADLRARLARSEAERDELAGKLARARDEEGGATGGAAL
ncbi:MAG TPA: hypothetical protein VJ787_06605, partial [Thermoleophilia bacterium]|nr:hypothetical protein [Thermoleophilia bacterium]